MATRALVVAAPVVLAVLAGCAGPGNETVKGSTEVDDFQGNCAADFSDISSGSQAVVTDSSGKVIGTGTLSYDETDSSEQSGLQPGLSVCIYSFQLTVPTGLPRYGITVSHRGTVWFTGSQMKNGPGLSLSSGGSGL